ncbi:MAG TPA: HD domain-containing protein [Gemmataceae bacterium]|jgi:3'-5' exoribonuclease|nr:HD domain-containing protein [Gemmataceae bacterium]
MPRSKPPILRLCELEPGQQADFFALLAERGKGATRDGKPYFTCRFRDKVRTASFMVWGDGEWFEQCEADWKVGQCFKIRAVFGLHERYGPQLDIQQIRPVNDEDQADGFDPLDFVESSRFVPDEMFEELCKIAETLIIDEGLRLLVLTLLERHAERLKRIPATQRHFFPFAGGFIEHTLSVTRSCLMLADRYIQHYPELKPPLNRDVLLAGAILHDIGRVAEFDDGIPAQQTVPGRLFGHLFLGRDLIRDAAREIEGLNPELLQLLEHLLITHLNLPEWGSPRLPLIPESLILHHADDLDAKLEMYVRCLTKDTADGLFTDRDPVLNRQLFKGRSM